MGGNVFVVVFITEGQELMGFYDHIPNPDFVSLPGNICDRLPLRILPNGRPRCKVHLKCLKYQ